MDGVLWNFSINQNLKNHVKLKTENSALPAQEYITH